MKHKDAFDPVTLEILWSRLLAIVDESALALQRTSFSTTVRESNDFAAVLLAPDGTTLAENSLGAPSFAGVMTLVMRHFLDRYPAETWRPGDVALTNDPWFSTGHLPDTTTITPIFHRGRLVAFTGNTSHKADIGGVGYAADAAEVFEEGLRIPICKVQRGGELNEDVMEFIRANVRVPDSVLGDLHAQIAAGHVCGERVVEFLEEQDVPDLAALGDAIQGRAESAMRQAIAEVPDGEYRFEMEIDGFERPTRIVVTVRVRGDELEADFTGTSAQSRRGINAVFNYTYAFSCYTVKCVLDPFTRKTGGSYRPMRIIAPEGSILNARRPAAVNARSMTGHCVSSALLGALSQALPDRVIADSGSCPGLRVACYGVDRHGSRFAQILFPNGGMGARPHVDGLSCTGFPTNAGCAAVEVMEGVAPLVFWERELLPDSGGPGRQRGGLGQRVVVEVVSREPVALSTQFDRIDHPAWGLFGGLPGGAARLVMNGSERVPAKGRVIARPGDRLTIHYAGGGGYGPPTERARALVARDLRDELISAEAARAIYGYDGGPR
ncbi:MAG: hydantoinase B/oxoprolinase family protein [Candidatus Rokubacteria bacterium]|nr:hydantoinase B/oxoprolinase family protein [Candidatus Rokubacteria bacterium]